MSDKGPEYVIGRAVPASPYPYQAPVDRGFSLPAADLSKIVVPAPCPHCAAERARREEAERVLEIVRRRRDSVARIRAGADKATVKAAWDDFQLAEDELGRARATLHPAPPATEET